MRRSWLCALLLVVGACGHAQCARNSDCDEGEVCSLQGTCGQPIETDTVDAGGDASDGGGPLDAGSDAAIVDADVDLLLDGGP